MLILNLQQSASPSMILQDICDRQKYVSCVLSFKDLDYYEILQKRPLK